MSPDYLEICKMWTLVREKRKMDDGLLNSQLNRDGLTPVAGPIFGPLSHKDISKSDSRTSMSQGQIFFRFSRNLVGKDFLFGGGCLQLFCMDDCL